MAWVGLRPSQLDDLNLPEQARIFLKATSRKQRSPQGLLTKTRSREHRPLHDATVHEGPVLPDAVVWASS